MVTMPKNEGGEFETVPEGTHLATCYRVVDLGRQESSYEGKKSIKRQVMISWEFPNELMSDGRPFTIHKTFTLSSSEKATLRKTLESWRGQKFTDEELGSFNIAVLIGKPALISIVHQQGKDGNIYTNIASVSRVMKGMVAEPLVNAPVHFDLEKFDSEAYGKLSDSLRAKIAKSPEYLHAIGNHVPTSSGDDIPWDEAPPYASV
jgi:hypothetical protein